MLAYVDFFLGGDEKRTDLPPGLPQRFPMSIIFGGDGSYMAPFSLQNDNILTSLMSQVSSHILGMYIGERHGFIFQILAIMKFFLLLYLLQLVQPTTWYRLVAGLNAQLRLVRRGRLRVTFRSVLQWLQTHANPALRVHGVRIDLAWFQATPGGYRQYGLLVYSIEEENEPISLGNTDGGIRTELLSR